MAATQHQKVSYDSEADASSHSFTISEPVEGRLLVLVAAASAVLDTPSGWSLAVSATNDPDVRIFYRIAPAGFGTSVQFGSAFSCSASAVYMEYSPFAASPLDQTASNTSVANTGTTATTVQAEELLIGAVGAGTVTTDGNWSAWTNSFVEEHDLASSGGGFNISLGAANLEVAATGTYETSATAAGGTGLCGCIATFKIEAATPSSVPLPGPGINLARPGGFIKPWQGSPSADVTAIELVVDEAAQAHSAENVTLTQVHVLAVADATQAHTTDAIALTQTHQLVVQDAAQAHVADNVTLTQVHQLTVADATHGHTADNVVLTTGAITLVVADATQAHAADNVTLAQIHQLVVQDATHAHAADSVALAQTHVLTVADAVHVHSADTVALFVGELPIPSGHPLTVPVGASQVRAAGTGQLEVTESGHPLNVPAGTHVVEVE